MIAGRAYVGSFGSYYDMSAVSAFPNLDFALLEDCLCFHVLKECSVSLFMVLFDGCYFSELICQLGESFFLSGLCKAFVHVCTLVLWVMDQDINAGTALQKLMKKYTRQSGIPVKIRFLDWGSAFAELNKVLVNEAGEGNDYPDVLQLGSTWVPYFAKAGLIKPVDEMIDAVDTSRFYPEAMKSAHIGRDSVVYAIPWFLDIRGFFANERIWLELGLHDSEIETYPKFYGVLRAISEAKVANRQGVEVAPLNSVSRRTGPVTSRCLPSSGISAAILW